MWKLGKEDQDELLKIVKCRNKVLMNLVTISWKFNQILNPRTFNLQLYTCVPLTVFQRRFLLPYFLKIFIRKYRQTTLWCLSVVIDFIVLCSEERGVAEPRDWQNNYCILLSEGTILAQCKLPPPHKQQSKQREGATNALNIFFS